MNIRNRVKALRTVKASELAPNPKNWRTHPKAQQDALRGILAEVGYADALLARELPDGSLMLVDGHLRAETTPEQEVPVLILDINEAEADKLLLSLDPLAALAETNAQALDALLREVDTGSEGLQQMYADLAEAAELYQDDAKEIVEDEVPEPPADPITKPGDLWILGEHRLLCGDSTKAEDVERLMAGAVAEVMLTDPPYCSGGFQEAGRGAGSIGTRSGLMIANDALSTRGYQSLMKAVLGTFEPSCAYMFTDWRQWISLFDCMESSGFGVRSMIVWDKGSPGMGRGWRCQHELVMFGSRITSPFEPTDCHGNVIKASRTGNPDHPTQKPVDLLATIIKTTSFATVFCDPFCGSGTTLIAAEQLGRKCYGMEISPQYCDVIVKRWETLTGKKAELEASNGQARPAQRADDPEDRQGQPRQKAAQQKRTKAAKR
jgi:DNA modification methylase